MKKILFLGLSVVLFFGFYGCKDEIIVDTDDIGITRPWDVVSPLLNGHFEAKDLLERLNDSLYIYTDEEGLIHFRYDQDLFAEWNDIVKLDEINFNQSYDISGGKKSPQADFVYESHIRVNLNPDQRFDSLTFATALMNIDVTIPDGFSGEYNISFPEMTNTSGDVLAFSGSLGDGSFSDSENISGYDIRFSHAPDSSYFTIRTQLTNVTVTGNPTGTSIDIGIRMTDVVPEVVFGYFGQVDALNSANVLEFDFFKDFDFSDVINLKGVKFILDIDNYFGVPIRATIDSAIFERTSTNEVVELNFLGTNEIMIESATFADSIVATNNFLQIDESNSNLDDAINLYADKITYGITALVNPDGEQSTNFVTRNNKIEGNMQVVLPFTFRIRDFNRLDTMAFSFKDAIDSAMIDFIDYAALNFDVSNEFPFDLAVSVTGVNENYSVIDTIFSDYFCKSGQLNADGEVTAPKSTNFQIRMDNSLLKKLHSQNSEYLFIEFTVNSGGDDDTFVKLYDHYAIDFSLNFEMKSGEISN